MLRRSDPSASRGIPAEMQGSAFAIEVAPIPRSARTTIWLVVAVLVCGLAWAQWAEMDEIVVAQGKLTTVVLPTVIQPLETAVIKRLDGRIGETVCFVAPFVAPFEGTEGL